MESKLRKLIQIGVIVPNVDKAISHYEKDLGIGPWRIEIMTKDSFKEMTLNGKPSTMELKCAFCSCYGMEIELIEPLNDSPQMDWLKKHGPGIQHLAFRPQGEFGEFMDYAKALNGKEPFMHGKDPSVGMEFAYLDLVDETGLIVEIHNEAAREDMPGHNCY